MIRNNARSKFDIERRLAEIGMKAALASVQFGRLDADADGVRRLRPWRVATYCHDRR